MRLERLLVALTLVAGCHHPAPPPAPRVDVSLPTPPPEPPWTATVAAVRAASDSGKFALADSILVAFERAEAGTPAVIESEFWRAMLRADPRNPVFTPPDARAGLEAYLTMPNATRRTEASVMLRMLAISDSLRAFIAAQRSAAETRDRLRDDEAQRLRDELQRTQAELDRIKKRLGSPKP